MRPIQIACQFSFCPVGVEGYSSEIDRVLELISDSALHVDIGPMSTIVQGDSGAVLGLIEKIIDMQAKSGLNYIMNITISNICGCT